MRKSPRITPRVCEMCGREYTPKGNTQKYCEDCKAVAKRNAKDRYYKKKFPNAKPKQKTTEPCCICGGKFAGFFDGKPY